MSDGGPGTGNIIAGIFLILFGLCITLVGGGCTILFLTEFSNMFQAGMGMLPLFLIALVTLGAGISLIWIGVKLMTGGFNR